MLKSRSKEDRFWWPLPLAATIWLIIIWAFGFFLTSPEVETETPAPIEATFVELPEEKPEQKSLPVPKKSPKLAPPVKPQPQPQPKPRPQPRLSPEKTQPAKPAPEKGTARSDARADRSSTQKSAPDTAAPKDMLDYMKEARERRSAGGIFEDEPVEPEATEREPSAEELRMANVMRNLREPGASGIFQIIRMGPRSAQFLFRAWKKDSSNPRRELIQVNAPPGVDIERAVVRKMIELIREYHKGDFNWESYRLDRVVVLSARLEDSKGLEDFLIREFFGEPAAPLPR
ncbi:hypothetical protein [Nitrosovibrio sp. Nv6]|uniref:hypothetical protein n=1 Tax=Nitrosovibrio sp. Nv6 TaxID=1855340 RepID=UPI0008C784FF|nr:hypothetical protein [Nitrosovibrio sp. Nv6]SEO88167.1 hypothetical protein SAMN05216316_1350 [Nitrosovibrio sp. Nv6]